MALAKVQEQKLQLKKIPPKLFSPYPPLLPTPTHIPPFTSLSKTFNTTQSQLPTTVSSHTTKPTIQKLSYSQIQTKRENGLCFYCDENIFLSINVRLLYMCCLILIERSVVKKIAFGRTLRKNNKLSKEW